MMITLEKATQESMTRPSLSVRHTSFLWALCSRSWCARPPIFCGLQGSQFTLLGVHQKRRVMAVCRSAEHPYSGLHAD